MEADGSPRSDLEPDQVEALGIDHEVSLDARSDPHPSAPLLEMVGHSASYPSEAIGPARARSRAPGAKGVAAEDFRPTAVPEPWSQSCNR